MQSDGPVRFRERRAARAALAIAALVASAAGYWPHIHDDLFITLAYAHEWVDSGILRWTSGEVVEGYSNFLWLAALVPVIASDGDAAIAAKWLAFGCAAVFVAIVAWWSPLDRRGHVLTASVVTCSPIAFWSVAGLETPLFGLLLALGWAGVVAGGVRRGPGLAALAVSGLAHPEGHAYLVLGAALSIWRDRRWFTSDAAAIVATVGLGAFHAWRIGHFGHVLPTPYLVKVASVAPGWAGVAQLGRELGTLLGVLAALLLLFGRPGAWVALVPLIAQAALLVRANGDWMAHGRFLVPGLMATVLAGCVVATPTGDRRQGAWWLVAAATLVAMLFEAPDGRLTLRAFAWPSGAFRGGVTAPCGPDVAFITERVPTDHTIMTGDVGLAGNVPGVRVRDRYGLVDREVAERALESEAQALARWKARYGAGPGQISFLRVTFPAGEPPGPLPGWLQHALPLHADVGTPPFLSRWHYADVQPPDDVTVAARWAELARRYPSVPWLRWRALVAEAGLGRVTERVQRPDGFPGLQELPASLSFTASTGWLTWEAGRGAALYQNGTLTSRPLLASDADAFLELIVADPGDDGARVRVDLGGCSRTVALTAPVRFAVTELCTFEVGTRLLVAFENDASDVGFDRNVFAAIRHSGAGIR